MKHVSVNVCIREKRWKMKTVNVMIRVNLPSLKRLDEQKQLDERKHQEVKVPSTTRVKGQSTKQQKDTAPQQGYQNTMMKIAAPLDDPNTPLSIQIG